MSNIKLNVYKKVLQKACEKFNGAEVYIKEIIKVLCSERGKQKYDQKR